MSSEYSRVRAYVEQLLKENTEAELMERLVPKATPARPDVPRGNSPEQMSARLDLLNLSPPARRSIADDWSTRNLDCYRRNIENYIGTAKVPLALAGPLRVNGLFAQGDYYIPLATTEAALVGSYDRGARLITRAGGCTAILVGEGISRAPGLVFDNLMEAGRFAIWAQSQFAQFGEVVSLTTRHGKLVDMKLTIEGNHVYLYLEFTTGQAAGQNMVTIATQAICSYIGAESPARPKACFIEANLSGDKKASFQAFQSVRGKKVSAEVTIPAHMIGECLHTTPARLIEYWQVSVVGSVLSSTIGLQGQYANALAALYIACGQDVACVAESSVGLTRLEMTERGDLYAAVSLPNLIIGTVGGGTGLPSQNACLEILALEGPHSARALAEICAALCLAGELSIAGAVCADEFARAHRLLARHERGRRSPAHRATPSTRIQL